MKRDEKGRFAKEVPDISPERAAELDAKIEKAKATFAANTFAAETAKAPLGFAPTVALGKEATKPVDQTSRWYGERASAVIPGGNLLGSHELWSSAGVAIVVIPNVTSVDGQIVPCVVFKNHSGFYRTGWLWGTDIERAQGFAARFNENLGLAEDEAFGIFLSSIQAEARPKERAKKAVWS